MRDDKKILSLILEDISDIQEFTKGIVFETFIEDKMLIKAVSMSLINIGEIVKHLSTSYKTKHNKIPWKNISGLRDLAAHKYHSLNLDIIWMVVETDIPKLKSIIENN